MTNQDGLVISSSESIKRVSSVATSAYFQFHKNNNSTALQVESVQTQAGSEPATIQFSRRLDALDESFAGVVVISVDVTYLLSFYDDLTFGRAGMLALQDPDGMVRVGRIGDAAGLPMRVALAPDLQGGERLVPASAFADNRERFVGW